MKHAVYLGAALALGLVASPAVAQSTSPPGSAPTQQEPMTRHGMSHHTSMSMHGRMSDRQMRRWCQSMSHRRMMMNRRCRSMMQMHHSRRMHHM
jgi:hypothetical protein